MDNVKFQWNPLIKDLLATKNFTLNTEYRKKTLILPSTKLYKYSPH